MNEPLLNRAAIAPGSRVLDIGCGSGSITRQAAEAAGADGRVTGVDLSEVLLKTALSAPVRDKSAPVDYVLGDAQTHAFEPASIDRFVSRMGVMFFADPVAAFVNLKKAAKPDAVFTAVVWRRGKPNPWFSIPTEAACRCLGPVEADAHAPGPLAFADVDRTVALLEAAGWTDARGESLNVILETKGTAEDAARSIGSMGPAARIMQAKGATARDAKSIMDDIAKGFQQFETTHGLRVPVTMTLLSAKADS